jgi:hypothetical protein
MAFAVYGDADVDLPAEENILLLQDRFKALGGNVTVNAKPGVGHHPPAWRIRPR